MKKIVREEILLKDNKLRYAEYYGMTEIFDELYAKSKAGNCFKNLMDIIHQQIILSLHIEQLSEIAEVLLRV